MHANEQLRRLIYGYAGVGGWVASKREKDGKSRVEGGGGVEVAVSRGVGVHTQVNTQGVYPYLSLPRMIVWDDQRWSLGGGH